MTKTKKTHKTIAEQLDSLKTALEAQYGDLPFRIRVRLEHLHDRLERTQQFMPEVKKPHKTIAELLNALETALEAQYGDLPLSLRLRLEHLHDRLERTQQHKAAVGAEATQRRAA